MVFGKLLYLLLQWGGREAKLKKRLLDMVWSEDEDGASRGDHVTSAIIYSLGVQQRGTGDKFLRLVHFENHLETLEHLTGPVQSLNAVKSRLLYITCADGEQFALVHDGQVMVILASRSEDSLLLWLHQLPSADAVLREGPGFVSYSDSPNGSPMGSPRVSDSETRDGLPQWQEIPFLSSSSSASAPSSSPQLLQFPLDL